MESTDISAPNGNLAEYFVSYGGEENAELIMQTGSNSSEGCDQSGSIYISTPPDIRVEHVSVDKDGNLILQTSSSKADGNTCDQPKNAQVAQPCYTSLPSTSQAVPSENTFITYKDSVVVEENKELALPESSAANSDQKIFLLQPNSAENVNVLLANTVNNNAELAALKQGNENIVLNIITEDGQKLENVILTQDIGETLNMKPKVNLDTFPLSDGRGRKSQQTLQSYSKSITPGVNLEKTRGYPGRRKPTRGRGRSTYVPQPVLREFHMEKKFEMLSNFQELVKTSSQSKIKSSTTKLSTSNSSKSDTVRAVNTDQNTIILTRSQPQQSLLQHPKTSIQTSNESVKTLSSNSAENTEKTAPLPVSAQLLTRPPKTPTIPKLVTTPVMMKTSDLKGMSHKSLQQLISMKGAQVSTGRNPAVSARKGSNQMSTVVVIVPPCSKGGTLTADTDTKEKPLLENPSIMFSQNSSSNRTMLYEIPAKIVKFQEDKPLQRKLPFRHQDYLKVTKIQNEGEPIRPPGRFYKSRGTKKSVQISIPVVEKLPDGKGTKIVNSAQQLNSMYPLLSSRLPQIAKLVDSSNMNIPQGILETDAAKSELGESQDINSGTLQDRTCTAMNIKSSFLPVPESSVSAYQKLELQVTDKKVNIVGRDVRHIGLKSNAAAHTPESTPTFRHSNVLRTYQELRSISQKGRSSSPSKIGSKDLKQTCLMSSTLASEEESSKVTNIEIRQAAKIERQNEHNSMKPVTLESVLKGLKVASPVNSTKPAATSCTFKSDSAIEQRYCHEKSVSATSRDESVLNKNLECTTDSVLSNLYLNKQHCPTSIASTLPENSDTNLTENKTDSVSGHTFQKEDELQLLPHSQNETNSENSISYNQSSVSILSLLAPQTSLGMKYEVQTSVARNLSAGLKSLDLDSFLALSTDDDEVGKDVALISKEVGQETISKHEELPVDPSTSKSEIVSKLPEYFPEGVLYIENDSSPVEKNLTEKPGGSNMKPEESSGMSEHTRVLNVHSEVGIVDDVTDSNVRNISESRSLDSDVEHEMETKNVSANTVTSEINTRMLQNVSTDSTQNLKLLSYGDVGETALQMQDLSKDSNFGNTNVSELTTKALEQTKVSGSNIDEPVKLSAPTKASVNERETISSELRLEGQKTILSHDSLDEGNSNTQHATSLQCSDQSNATSENITIGVNALEMNTKIKVTNIDFEAVLQSSSDGASLASSEQKAAGSIGNSCEAERAVNEHLESESFSNKGDNTVLESELGNKLVTSEISGLRLTGEMDYRKEIPNPNSDNTNNAETRCLTSSEPNISELAEEKLQETSSLKNKILSELHFTKTDDSDLLDEVTALHKQPALLETILTCSGENDAEMSTGMDKISNNTITQPEHSSFHNVNLETSSDEGTKSEENRVKTDAPLEPMPSMVSEERYSKQDDSRGNSGREENISASRVDNNAELDTTLYTCNTESKTLSSQDKDSLRANTAAHDPHIEKHQNETAIGSSALLRISPDADDSANPVLKTVTATGAQLAAASKSTDFMLQGEKGYDNAKAESSEMNSSTDEKLNTADVSPNVGILTGINVLATKEANPTGVEGSNLSKINFINLLQPSKKLSPTGVSKGQLLGYGNTLLLLQGSNSAVAARNEQSTLSLGNQIRSTDASKTVDQSSHKAMEPLPGFVLEGEGQLTLSGQTSALQSRTEKEPDNPNESAAENSLFKVSDLDASSNTFAVEPLHAKDVEGDNHHVDTGPGIPKQAGRERRRRKQSLEELRLPEEFMKMEVLPLQEPSPVKKKRRYRKRKCTLADMKQELESSEQTSDYCREMTDESKELDENRLITANNSQSADTCRLLVNLQEIRDKGESFSNQVSNLTKLKGGSEEHLFISNRTGPNLKESEGQCSQKVQAGMGNKKGMTNAMMEGEIAVPHSQEGSRDEDEKAEESKGMPPQTPKLLDANFKAKGSHLKRKLFKQLSSEDLSKKDEKKSKRILSKATSLDHSLLSTDVEHKQHSPEADGPGSSTDFTVISQSTKKPRVNFKKQKTEEDIIVQDDSHKIASLKAQKIIKSSSPCLGEAVQSKISDSKNKKAVPVTVPQKQLSKIKVKGLKESIRSISRRSSAKYQFKKDGTPEIINKSIISSDKSSFPAERKEPRTARLIRELKKRMTTRYRKQEHLDSVSKKENLKLNAKKLKTETKTNVMISENQEQDKTNLRRSARQYIRKKITKIRMSLKTKHKSTDTSLLSTKKRISSVEKLKSVPSQKWKTRSESNDRKKCAEKIMRSKPDKRKKMSTSGRKSLQTQRSSSPEYPIAIPMPQDTCSDETAQKENEDDKITVEADDDSETNVVSTNTGKDCAAECDTAGLESSTRFKIISEENIPNAEGSKEVAVESDRKIDISLKADGITERSETTRFKADINAKGSNVTTADAEEMRMEDASKLDQAVSNLSDKETVGTSKLDDQTVCNISNKETVGTSKLDDQAVSNISDKETVGTSKLDDQAVSNISDKETVGTSKLDDQAVSNISDKETAGTSKIDDCIAANISDKKTANANKLDDQAVSNISDKETVGTSKLDDQTVSNISDKETVGTSKLDDQTISNISDKETVGTSKLDDQAVSNISDKETVGSSKLDDQAVSNISDKETVGTSKLDDQTVSNISDKETGGTSKLDDQAVSNRSDKETVGTSKLDDQAVCSDVQVDKADKEFQHVNRDLTDGVEMGKSGSVSTEGEKLQTNQQVSTASDSLKTEKDTKPELPKKKFFKHREPGQMRNKRFTCIFNIEENENELFESAIKTGKPTTSALEGRIRDTEEYRMYGKRTLEIADYHELTESATEEAETHMLDIGINLPEIPNITFRAPSERKWPLAAKEMKCYMGKRRRLLDDAEEEEEEELEKEEVKEELQEEPELQSSRWPEATRKRCYPGKRPPKFSQDYHSCSFLEKRSPERASFRCYGKSTVVDSPEGGADKTLSQFKQRLPKMLSKCAAIEDNRQQKCNVVNPLLPTLDDEGKLEDQVSTSSAKRHTRMQAEESRSGKKEVEQRYNVPPHLLGRNIGDPASDPTERKRPLQQPRIGVRVPYRNLTSQIVSSQEIVREILERSRVRSTAIAMAMNKRVADAVDRSFSKRLNASLARVPMPNGPEELEAALQASAGTKLKLLPQSKERNWHVGLPGVIGSSATTTVTTLKSSSSYAGNKSGTRSRSSARGKQETGFYLDKESERELALRQLETLPTRCRSSRRQAESASAVKVTKPKKLDWCKQRSRRKQSK